MADNQLTITLEQREWDRLVKLSERNGESKESLVAKMLAADLAKIFNKPPDIPWNSEVKRVYESFVEGRNQTNIPTTGKPEPITGDTLLHIE